MNFKGLGVSWHCVICTQNQYHKYLKKIPSGLGGSGAPIILRPLCLQYYNVHDWPKAIVNLNIFLYVVCSALSFATCSHAIKIDELHWDFVAIDFWNQTLMFCFNINLGLYSIITGLCHKQTPIQGK